MKTCNCIHELDEKLKEKNLKISGYGFMMPNFAVRIQVSTEWIDREKAPKGRKRNPPAMIASHCPFCGVKYPELEKEEE